MKRPSAVYTAGQASKAAGVAYHQLNHWATVGIVVPSVGEGEGYAGVRGYSLPDVVALKVAAMMKDGGFTIRKLQALMSAIQRWDEQSSETYFVVNENGSVSAYDEAGAFAALRQMKLKGLTWFVNIMEIAEEIKQRLQSLSRPARGKTLRIA